MAVPCETKGALSPFTRASAKPAGWQWRIPLQHRVGNGIVYCSDFLSEDEATAGLLANLEGQALASPNQLKFSTGRRKQFWNRNVVAIGLAAGFLEPLESTSIHLIQEGITELVQLFPDQDFRHSDIDEYNRRMELNFERVRDFLLLHYVANQREGEMWRHFRNLRIPESLQEKIDAWSTRAFVIKYEFGVFLPPSWIAVMLGQNLIPRGFDPRANAILGERIAQLATATRGDVSRAVQNAPRHLEIIQRIGGTSGTPPLSAASSGGRA